MWNAITPGFELVSPCPIPATITITPRAVLCSAFFAFYTQDRLVINSKTQGFEDVAHRLMRCLCSVSRGQLQRGINPVILCISPTEGRDEAEKKTHQPSTKMVLFKEYKFQIRSFILILENVTLDNRKVTLICQNHSAIIWLLLC